MNDQQNHDEALARLRASDPATGSYPDVNGLRELVAAKAPGSQGTDAARVIKDTREHGIRAPWIAAAAVAALGMGAGGYAIGAAQGDDPGTGTLAGGTVADSASGDSDGMLESGMQAEGPSPLGFAARAADSTTEEATDDAAAGMWDMGPVRLTAGPGLSTEPTTGEVRVLRSEEDPEEFIQAWADRLDMDLVSMSESEYLEGQQMMVNGDLGIVLTVSGSNGSLDISFEDVYGSEYCSTMYEGMSEEDINLMKQEMLTYAGPGYPLPDVEKCRTIEGAAPSDEQAISASMDFMRTVGIDPDLYSFEAAEQWEDEASAVRYVEAMLEGSSPNGAYLGFSFTVTPDGVVSSYGSVGEMVSLGDYPVISPAEAVERYNLREFTNDYAVYLAEDWDDLAWSTMPEMEYPDLPEFGPLAEGEPLPLLLATKEVTGAELVTGQLWTQTGTVDAPTWKLTTDDGMSYAVLALADEAIEWVDWTE